MNQLKIFALALVVLFTSCNSSKMQQTARVFEKGIAVAQLGRNDQAGLKRIRNAFVKNNVGYDLHYVFNQKTIKKEHNNRILFMQSGGGTATLSNQQTSKFSVGDIILLKPNETLQADSLWSALVFTVPTTFSSDIPSFIRPDWDSNITDTPGGCATETNAYRRILLTWKKSVGTYLFHHLNAHRVRIMDSFSHYHPKVGGFDEFYLVQMAQPKARLITSQKVDLIKNPMAISAKQAQDLLETTPLKVGDLVYIPRGIMHRGVDGILAQVITVPGFVPGSEIGVDHHLKTINEQLHLTGEAALPYNVAASSNAIIK